MGIRWDPRKNEQLKRSRGLSFEEIVDRPFLGSIDHPKRGNQKLFFFEVDGYVWVVPSVRNGDDVFFKTLYRSRLYTRRWIRGELR